MKFSIKIDSDNAAFADDPMAEIARILRETADRIDNGTVYSSHPVGDINGNMVGTIAFKP